MIVPTVNLARSLLKEATEQGLDAVALGNINEGEKPQVKRKFFDKASSGNADIIIVTANHFGGKQAKLKKTAFWKAFKNDSIAFVVIDEVHLANDKGWLEFYEGLKRLGSIRKSDAQGVLRIFMFSATVPPFKQDTLFERLGIDQQRLAIFRHETCFHPGLFLEMRCLKGSSYINVVRSTCAAILSDWKRNPDITQHQCKIIYFNNIENKLHPAWRLVYTEFRELIPYTACDHARVIPAARCWTVDRYRQGGLLLVLATCGFGIGLDGHTSDVIGQLTGVEEKHQQDRRAARRGNGRALCAYTHDGYWRVCHVKTTVGMSPLEKEELFRTAHMYNLILCTKSCAWNSMQYYLNGSWDQECKDSCSNCTSTEDTVETLQPRLQSKLNHIGILYLSCLISVSARVPAIYIRDHLAGTANSKSSHERERLRDILPAELEGVFAKDSSIPRYHLEAVHALLVVEGLVKQTTPFLGMFDATQNGTQKCINVEDTVLLGACRQPRGVATAVLNAVKQLSHDSTLCDCSQLNVQWFNGGDLSTTPDEETKQETSGVDAEADQKSQFTLNLMSWIQTMGFGYWFTPLSISRVVRWALRCPSRDTRIAELQQLVQLSEAEAHDAVRVLWPEPASEAEARAPLLDTTNVKRKRKRSRDNAPKGLAPERKRRKVKPRTILDL